MWKIKNNSTGEDCVAIFPGINVDCSSEKIEVVHTGKLLGGTSKAFKGCC